MSEDYTTEMTTLAAEVSRYFGAIPRWVSYSGGVPGMEIRLMASEYDAVKKWLTEIYGQPEVLQPWHPLHTKKVPPLRFRVTPHMEHMKVSHINLISMMQRENKRYVLLTWM